MAYLGNNSLPFDPTKTSVAPRDADRFSGNGSTTSFTLSRSVSLAVDIEVFVENVQQEPITAYDVNGTTLTFTGAPPSGTNNVYVVYRNFQSGAQVTMPDGSITYSKLANNLRVFTTDNLTPNGNNAVFTLSEPPADANTVFVTVDGVVQRAPVHYTTSGSTITFTSNPPAGSNVHVRHLGFRTSTTVTAIPVGTYIPQPNIATPIITGPATVANGVYSQYDFTGTYTDGIVMDYTTGTGRLTVGSSDGLTIYNGGPSSRSALMSIDTNKLLGTVKLPCTLTTHSGSGFTSSSGSYLKITGWNSSTYYEAMPSTAWDSANQKIIPKVAGYYLIDLTISMYGSTSGGWTAVPAIYKNGSNIYGLSYLINYAGGHTSTYRSWIIVSANGSTDYFEGYFYQNSGTSLSAQAGSFGVTYVGGL